MDSSLVLVVEQVAPEPTQCFFTGTLWSLRMSMEEMGTKFDEQPGPIRDTLTEHLDAEVVGLEDESIPAACAMGQDLSAEPVRAMYGVNFVSFLRRQFLSSSFSWSSSLSCMSAEKWSVSGAAKSTRAEGGI